MNAFAHFLFKNAKVKVIEEQGSVQFRFEGPHMEHVTIEITHPDEATKKMVTKE